MTQQLTVRSPSLPAEKKEVKAEKAGHEVFEERLKELENRQHSYSMHQEWDWEEEIPNALKDGYKGRQVNGRLLHRAIELDAELERLERKNLLKPAVAYSRHAAVPGSARGMNGDRLQSHVQRVLDGRADPNAWAWYQAWGVAKVRPLHLAAGMGCVAAIRQLHERKADVNTKSLHKEKEHFCALHDAAFTRQSKAVKVLLELGADPGIPNMDGKTPLHIVAMNGAVDIARMMCQDESLQDSIIENTIPHEILQMKTKDSKRAMDIALETRTFKDEDLFLLAPFFCKTWNENGGDFLEEIRKVMKVNTNAAHKFIWQLKRKQDMMNGDNQKPQTSLDKLVTGTRAIQVFAHMLTEAPEVSLELLDLLFLKPLETHPERHRCPRMASFQNKRKWIALWLNRKKIKNMHTEYEVDIDWKYSFEDRTEWGKTKVFPEWHEKVAPKPRQNSNDKECELRVLAIANILDTRILHAINGLNDPKYFKSKVIQAIVHCAWKVVRNANALNIGLEVSLVFCLTWWACGTPESQPQARKYTMSFVWATIFRELFVWSWEFLSHMSWGFPAPEFLTPSNLVAFFRPLLLVTLLLNLHEFFNESAVETVFCANVLMRWVNLIALTSTVTNFGEMTLAITNSAVPLRDVSMQMMLLFAAFFSAFASISRERHPLGNIMADLFFFALIGDGEAMIRLRKLDGLGHVSMILLVLSVVVFSVIILNLIIAIYSKTYNERSKDKICMFHEFRCQTIEAYLLRPQWKRDYLYMAAPFLTESVYELLNEFWEQVPLIASCLLMLLWLFAIFCVDLSTAIIPVSFFLTLSTMLLQVYFTQNNIFNRSPDVRTIVIRKRARFQRSGWQVLDSVRASLAEHVDDELSEDLEDSIEEHDFKALYLWVCYPLDDSQEERQQEKEDKHANRINALENEVKGLKSVMEEMKGSFEGMKKAFEIATYGQLSGINRHHTPFYE